MTPTLRAGDWLLALPMGLPGVRPRAGSLVVARHPERPELEIIKRAASPEPTSFFLLGDNPAASTDSRHFGPLSVEQIDAVVVGRYWPLRRVRPFRP